MVKSIYVARHGLRANHDPPPTGIDGDPRLTKDGEQQAVELGNFVSDPRNLGGEKIAAIYSSPFYRCLQTATPASQQLSLPIWVETGIGEYYTVNRPTHPVPWPASRSKSVFPTIDLSYSPQVSVNRTGETRESLEERVSKALDAIIAHADQAGFETILIVTHAAVKIVIGEVLSGKTVRAGTCSLDRYERVDGESKPFKVTLLGDTSFLSGGEQMHWSFDMAYEAGSAADEASRKHAAGPESSSTTAGDTAGIELSETQKSLVSLDLSALSEEEKPASLDPSHIVFAKMESDRPVVRIGSNIYEGEWQRTVGTDVYTSTDGEPLGTAKYRIKLFPANIQAAPQDRRTLLDRLAEAKEERTEKPGSS